MSRQKAFTLIEVMVVVAIISILAAIAIPNYRNQTIQARRSEGITLLLEIMQRQERYFTEELTYETDLTLLGITVNGLGNAVSENGFYTVSAGSCAGMTGVATCVNLTATPQNSQAGDGNITLNSRGNRTPAEFWR